MNNEHPKLPSADDDPMVPPADNPSFPPDRAGDEPPAESEKFVEENPVPKILEKNKENMRSRESFVEQKNKNKFSGSVFVSTQSAIKNPSGVAPRIRGMKVDPVLALGRRGWGAEGYRIFKLLDQQDDVGRPTLIMVVGSKGTGKTRMVETWLEARHPHDWNLCTKATSPSFFGGGSVIVKKGKSIVTIHQPELLAHRYTLLSDFSAMGLAHQDFKDFCGGLNALGDGHIAITKDKMKGGELDQASKEYVNKKTAEGYALDFRPETGKLYYQWHGMLIMCVLPEFLSRTRDNMGFMIPQDTQDRFRIYELDETASKSIFEHVLRNGFLPETKVPRLTAKEDQDLVRDLLHPKDRNLRRLLFFMQDIAISMKKRGTKDFDEFDLAIAISEYAQQRTFVPMIEKRAYLCSALADRFTELQIAKMLGIKPPAVHKYIVESEASTKFAGE